MSFFSSFFKFLSTSFPFSFNVQFREKSFTPYSNLEFKEFLKKQSKRHELISIVFVLLWFKCVKFKLGNMNSDPFNSYSNNLGNIALDVSSSYIFFTIIL
jgi:hypothetical protein